MLLSLTFTSQYTGYVLGTVVVLAIAILSLNLLMGYAGQVSLGQAAFVGLGAYTTAYLTTRFGASPWLALAVGMAITLAVALMLGFITLRMKGHYLPLATIAWGISLYFLFGNLDFLGGHTGMTGIPALNLFGFELRDGKSPHWTGNRNSGRTFGHFGQSGSFLWVDPELGLACASLGRRPFGDWAVEAWPKLSDAVIAKFARR